MSLSPASRSLALDYLRATLTVMVVAHHSSLAYTTFASSKPGNYLGGTAPIDDARRLVFLDHAENFNDVFFMSAMFFISGLFVWNALEQKSSIIFIRERVLRRGLPFFFGVIFVMPLGYYAAWLFAGGYPNYFAFWRRNLIEDGFSPGPLWFIWVLLLFNIVVAMTFPVLRRLERPIERLAKIGELQPLPLAALIVLVCAFAYFPFLARYGPSAWTAFVTGPFYFQQSRLALYFAWFAIGCVIGAKGLDRGLLNTRGPMVRHADRWLLAAVTIFIIMEFVPRALFDAGILMERQARGLYDGLWLISCVATTMAFLAMLMKYVRRPSVLMSTLARSSYTIYLVHYVFVLWIQYLLLETPMTAGIKFSITFAGAFLLSQATAWLLLRIPAVRAVL
jgi:glucans biosynthesis protein C